MSGGRTLIAVAALVLLAAPLAACGKKAAPSPPAGEAAGYPHIYPRNDPDLGPPVPASTPSTQKAPSTSPGLTAPVPEQ